MLFLLPFVSWYYLQSGLNWRKQAQVVMNGTKLFPEGKWMDHSGKLLASDDLSQHVSIISIVTCENKDSLSATLNAFYRQFKDTKKANFIILNACAAMPDIMTDTTKTAWYVFNCGESIPLCDSILLHWPAGKTHALIDRNKVIRAYYDETTKNEKRILLEHMALLLPRERSDQIELKRGTQK